MRKSFAEPELVALLEVQRDPEVARLARDRDVVRGLAAIFNASLDLVNVHPSRPTEAALGLAKKGAKMADLAATTTGMPGFKLGAFMGTQSVTTLGLVKMAGFTPARATLFVSATVAEKVVALGGFIDAPTLSRCQLALASMAATTVVTAATTAGTMGVAGWIGVLTVAAEVGHAIAECRQAPAR